MWPNRDRPDDEPRALLRARAVARDAVGALELALDLFERGGLWDALDAADVAVRYGDADVLWQVADLGYHYRGRGSDFAVWARSVWARAVRADHPLPVDGQPLVHRDVFGPRFAPGSSMVRVDGAVLVMARDPTGLDDAVGRATVRWLSVFEDGVERTEDEAFEAAVDAGLYNPNWVSDPRDGPIVVDTKGVGYGLMFRAFLRILVEELTTAGVRDAVVALAPDVEWEAEVADGLVWDEQAQAYAPGT